MEEKWKEIDWIPNLRGSYEVSNMGNVKRTSMLRHEHYSNTYQLVNKERTVVPFDNGNGYKVVGLPVDGKCKNFYVHRLVALAFIPNPTNKPVINHKDHDRSNNKASNLEWMTHQENTDYSAELMCHPRSSSIMRGIRLRGNYYEVGIYHKGKSVYVGRFDTLDQAIEARDKKDVEIGIRA